MQEMQLVIKQIVKFATTQKKSSPDFLEYAKIFYSQSVAKDFSDYQDEELYNFAASSFDFFSQKPANNFKIRLYNPKLATDGFESKYTILDIVNDDMPFLVDSVVIQLDSRGVDIKNIIHPILNTKRDSQEKIVVVHDQNSVSAESVMQLHLAKISDPTELKDLENRLIEILNTIKMTVKDWHLVVDLARKSGENLKNVQVKTSQFEALEASSFIEWLANNKFIFLGAIEFDIENKNGKYSYKEVAGSHLGIYKSPYEITKPTIVNISSEEIAETVTNPYLVEILKSRYKSQIHRFANAERIRVQKFDNKGNVIGEYRFVGLFTSSVYYQNSKEIPIVRKKIEQVVNKSGYSKNSSSYKDLLSVLESYPRDELFQISIEDLLRIATGIVAISGRSLVRMFARQDKFLRFVSCLIFIPRDNFNTSLREKIQVLIANAYQGEVSDVFVQIADSNLTRVHLIVRTDRKVPQFDIDDLEAELIKICRLWSDDFEDEVLANYDDLKAKNILETYRKAFSVSYTNRFDSRAAVLDVKYINQCLETGKVACDLYQSTKYDNNIVQLKLYSPEKELLLSGIMPILDSFGFNVVYEHTYYASPAGQKNVWIHYFHLNLSKSGNEFNDQIKTNFVETINKISSEETKIDHLNRLVVGANLNWRQIYIIRAYSKYLYQIGLRCGQNQISDTLTKYHNLTTLLVELFETKFNPNFSGNRENLVKEITKKIKDGLSQISDALEDSIIRKFFNVLEATVRTNFYQPNQDGSYKNYLSFKLNSAQILDMPLPVMYAEIFVYSVNVEGIHLRGGKVARGGLRWSDRHDDFRTEVLGLVKAQMTKNAVIVPVGSKGGFVVKKDSTNLNREQILQNGIEAYKTFLRGLLDVTDNFIDGKVINPENVIRYDDNDPYLVVAADKGTATFSDIANGVAAEYNFWLGDAFASGGSVGYDHKKMGITARGAWVAVRRHFSEIGIDIQNQDFTCMGIGDLSGDVFGNGMLLSKHTKLVAAFNHMHIFIDPNPDLSASFKERERMFNLPRSSWTDYDTSKISKGGGIFERSAKTIKLSTEAKEVLSISEDELTPSDLIHKILQAPVDLLWNGGIGTYVKASDESHLDVGDRVNDVLRVNGSQLKCKVVGEGGNLGFTQKGRIEASLNGVKMNTDAMDNSAGVDCSDHEVNIKIAMTAAMKAGKISLDERNKILEQMTDEVAELVLEDNKNQTGAVSVCYDQGYLGLGNQAQFLNSLEKSGLLNRAVEFLPTNKEISKRQIDKIGLTRPELCVMLAYGKMDLYPQILHSNLVEDKYFLPELFSYFPKLLQEKFADEITNHQLRSEIIATQITNLIINKVGITFVNQIASDTGFSAVDVVRNFIIVCDSFEIRKIWQQIEDLDGKVSSSVQSKMFLTINKLLERGVIWLLRNNQGGEIESLVVKYKSITTQLFEILDDILALASKESFEFNVLQYRKSLVPDDLAKTISAMDPLASAFDIAEIAGQSGLNIKVIAILYFEVGTRLSLKWLRSKALAVNVDNYWQKLSLKTILEDLYSYQMKIAKQVVNFSCSNKTSCPAEPSIEKWIESHSFLVGRYESFITELKDQVNPDLLMFVVALNRVRALV